MPSDSRNLPNTFVAGGAYLMFFGIVHELLIRPSKYRGHPLADEILLYGGVLLIAAGVLLRFSPPLKEVCN